MKKLIVICVLLMVLLLSWRAFADDMIFGGKTTITFCRAADFLVIYECDGVIKSGIFTSCIDRSDIGEGIQKEITDRYHCKNVLIKDLRFVH